MISHPKLDLGLINAAGFLRSFGVGLMGVVLGIYLFRSGLSSTAIGLIIAIGLAGSASALDDHIESWGHCHCPAVHFVQADHR
jgi:hypothetical protein